MQRTHSQRMRATIELASSGLQGRIHDFWFSDHLGRCFPEFLFALYGIVSASVPLLERAAEASSRLKGDPLAAELATYFSEHAEEERGHEQWLLGDLERLRISRRQVMERLPYLSASALVGGQYFLLEHVHPVAVLGYLAVLENPASPQFVRSAASRAGIPLEAMSTILRHAELDQHHVAEFDQMLDALPLTDRDRDVMMTSAIATVSALEGFFVEVLESFARDGELRDDSRCFRWMRAAEEAAV